MKLNQTALNIAETKTRTEIIAQLRYLESKLVSYFDAKHKGSSGHRRITKMERLCGDKKSQLTILRKALGYQSLMERGFIV